MTRDEKLQQIYDAIETDAQLLVVIRKAVRRSLYVKEEVELDMIRTLLGLEDPPV